MKKFTAAKIVFCFVSFDLFSQQAADKLDFEESNYGLSSNVSLVSNYIFRGESESDNYPAIQGGLDYLFSNEIDMGIWASSANKNSPLEIDIFTHYNYQLSDDLLINIKATGFIYPFTSSNNSLEASLAGYYKSFGLRYNYDFITYEYYIDFGIALPILDNLNIIIKGGVMNRIENDSRYYRYDIMSIVEYQYL